MMPILDLFWSMLWFFLFIAWLMLLFRVFGDIFRSEKSGLGKAGWVIFVIILPFLGVLIYVIANGGDMQKRTMDSAVAQQQAQRDYIQSVSADSSSAADEIAKLAKLHDAGTITNEEFQSQKAKLLA